MHVQIAKICNNLILGVTMAGVCEAFKLGTELGIDPKKLAGARRAYMYIHAHIHTNSCMHTMAGGCKTFTTPRHRRHSQHKLRPLMVHTDRSAYKRASTHTHMIHTQYLQETTPPPQA